MTTRPRCCKCGETGGLKIIERFWAYNITTQLATAQSVWACKNKAACNGRIQELLGQEARLKKRGRFKGVIVGREGIKYIVQKLDTLEFRKAYLDEIELIRKKPEKVKTSRRYNLGKRRKKK